MTDQLSLTKPNFYDQDFNLWLENTINSLKEGKLLEVDYDHLIEELEGMGRSEKNAIKSNLRILLMHLLKYQYQPEKRSNSWRYTITEHRQRIRDSLETSPSLIPFLKEIFDKCYQDSRRLASDDTGLSINNFPPDCPFTFDEVLYLD
ncbi:protein of unknown function DUF29 [Rippkaea orientalis PCC 8801]|uniref:DUF29 domain-containing protein n=1 Tax=Rippkaea orientalis (strain PCC 8801 / RF-1) TaxID=41431 RepID=B7JW95_RIPO1|nr:DUF29 domain-containing protein [Rippkaea orientalis]ACK66940.1 protein of unknown function DUF29 [Rippkaea orientalis PCC 8801]